MLESQFYDENGAWSNDNEVLRRETTRKPTRHEDPEADAAILLAPAAPAPAAPSPPPITFTFDAGVSMGIALNDINGTVVVTDVAANTPAAMKQVPLGATLVSINGESTLGKLRADVLKMIGAVQGERKLTFMPKAAPAAAAATTAAATATAAATTPPAGPPPPKYPVGSKCLVTRSTGEKSPCTVVAYDPKSRAYKVQVDGTDIYKMVREDMLEPAKQKNGDSPQKEPENILEALGQLSARIFGGAPREPEPADGANPMVEQEFSVDTTAIRVLVETNVETTSHASATPRWMQAPLLHTPRLPPRGERAFQLANAIKALGPSDPGDEDNRRELSRLTGCQILRDEYVSERIQPPLARESSRPNAKEQTDQKSRTVQIV